MSSNSNKGIMQTSLHWDIQNKQSPRAIKALKIGSPCRLRLTVGETKDEDESPSAVRRREINEEFQMAGPGRIEPAIIWADFGPHFC